MHPAGRRVTADMFRGKCVCIGITRSVCARTAGHVSSRVVLPRLTASRIKTEYDLRDIFFETWSPRHAPRDSPRKCRSTSQPCCLAISEFWRNIVGSTPRCGVSVSNGQVWVLLGCMYRSGPSISFRFDPGGVMECTRFISSHARKQLLFAARGSSALLHAPHASRRWT